MGEANHSVAVVTGGNKGIGLEIARQLANTGVLVVLTARDEKRGLHAVESLKQGGISDVLFHQVDVAEPDSAAALAEFIRTKFGKLDILVNNAGVGGVITPESQDFHSATEERTLETEVAKMIKQIAESKETYEVAEECININYYGTKRVTEELIPLLQLSHMPRIVNLASVFGTFQFLPNEKIGEQLRDINQLTAGKIDELLQNFLNDFKEGKVEANGWPTGLSAYKVSKLAINAYTRILAKKFPKFCINSVHPGFVRSDMTAGIGTMSPEEGARGPVMLALLPDRSPSGCYYDETKLAAF